MLYYTIHYRCLKVGSTDVSRKYADVSRKYADVSRKYTRHVKFVLGSYMQAHFGVPTWPEIFLLGRGERG
jgi:hypothetical protein